MARAGLAALRRRRVGYVFQELNLIAALTAVENVALPRELDGARARTARAEALAALELVGVAELADKFPDQLSGGEQQRVAIVRALVGQRPLLLADEPPARWTPWPGRPSWGCCGPAATPGWPPCWSPMSPAMPATPTGVIFLTDGHMVDQTHQPTHAATLSGGRS